MRFKLETLTVLHEKNQKRGGEIESMPVTVSASAFKAPSAVAQRRASAVHATRALLTSVQVRTSGKSSPTSPCRYSEQSTLFDEMSSGPRCPHRWHFAPKMCDLFKFVNS